MGGFQLLDLHDFPGQGTALVGVLDPFWEEKGYVTAKEYSRFCNATVLLARLPKRVFTTDESLEADVEIAHFGPAPITDGVAKWRLIDTRGKALASGELSAKTIPVGNGLALGHVRAELKRAPAPAQLKFVVSMAGTKIENDWDVWVYPAAHNAPTEDVLVTERLDQAAQHRLAQGGRVLWTIPAARVRNFENDPVALGFSSIFWNTAWTRRQAPTTLGILCDPGHPALAQFPTESHSNWQWWHLIHRAGALRLDLLPRGVNPIVRVIDDWVTARPLALLLEAKVGKGKIIVCGFDLTQDETADPVSRQMRANLLSYMDSKRFKPAASLSVEDLLNLAGAAASVPGK
jgi:hypothetical protein